MLLRNLPPLILSAIVALAYFTDQAYAQNNSSKRLVPVIQLLLDSVTTTPGSPSPPTDLTPGERVTLPIARFEIVPAPRALSGVPTSVRIASTTAIPANAIVVSNAVQLNAALGPSAGGVFILLNDGAYGDLNLRRKTYVERVTVRARNISATTFNEINLDEASNIEIDGVLVSDEISAERSDRIIVRNSTMSSTDFRFSTNALYDGNDARFVGFNDASYFTMSNNFVHDARADIVHIKGNAHHFLVQNNSLYDTLPDMDSHSDAIQMNGNRNGTPHDFILRGNYVFDDPRTNQPHGNGQPNTDIGQKLQGFFMTGARGDNGYYNLLIENNLINVSNDANTLHLAGVSRNATIRNNTLLPTEAGSGGGIRVSEGREADAAFIAAIDDDSIVVTKNISSSPRLVSEIDLQVIDNIFYNRDGINLSTLFTNPSAFGSWRNFIPKPGGRVDYGSGYGAETRVNAIVGSIVGSE